MDDDDDQHPFRDALIRRLTGSEEDAAEREARRIAYLDAARPIAESANVYAAVVEAMRRRGFAGDARQAELLYTVFTSRLLAQPMNALIKVRSAAANPPLLDRTLEMFTADQVEVRSGFSAKAIAYGGPNLRHKVLLVKEAGGLSGRDGDMLMRSLMAERQIRWEVARCEGTRCYTDEVTREGPMALVLMTTKDSFGHEDETAHLLPIVTRDTRADTDAAMAEIGRRFAGGPPADAAELAPWQAFQEVLESCSREAIIPFAAALGRLFPARTARARSWFEQLLTAVATSALLHQFTREHEASDEGDGADEFGRVIATLDDYAHARRMLEQPLADAAAAAAPPGVRELVDHLRDQAPPGGPDDTGKDGEPHGLDLTELAALMNVDKATAQRRAAKAKELGLAVDLGGGRGRPCRLLPVEYMRDDLNLLPAVGNIEAEMRSEPSAQARAEKRA